MQQPVKPAPLFRIVLAQHGTGSCRETASPIRLSRRGKVIEGRMQDDAQFHCKDG